MALVNLSFYSEELKIQTQVDVIIPQRSAAGEIGIGTKGHSGKYKCLYLLHGLTDDHTIWLRRTSIERYASQYGICVVMPFGGRSFYTDMKYGENYYSYIAKELPQRICEFFNVSDKREDNYIAGNSMGGYGALKIGLRECDRFCAAAGLSAVADIKAKGFTEAKTNIFGQALEIPDREDLFFLAEKTDSNPNKPRLFMGVGVEDYLYESNQRLREKLESLSYDFTYRESAGCHSWLFWDEYIQYVLEWLLGSE